MQRYLWVWHCALLVLCCLLLPAPARAATSIIVDEPGFYGRLDLGGFPSPRLLYPQALIIDRVATPPAPVYLRVPPGHAKNWAKHCHRYNACRQPVFFVDETWYNDVYVPRYREMHARPGPMRQHVGPSPGQRPVKVKEQKKAVQVKAAPGQAKVKANQGNSGNANRGKGRGNSNANPGKGPHK